MTDPNQPKDGEPPPRRNRAPTITIDTTAVALSPSQMPATDPQTTTAASASAPAGAVTPASPQDEAAASPSTAVEPLTQSWSSAQKPAGSGPGAVRPDLRMSMSFDSKDSRPQSPHNVSSPVRARGEGGGFLSVPSNLRSRQNSVDSEEGSHSFVSSQGETVAASSSLQSDKGRASSDSSSQKIMNDENALKPDVGTEADFKVEDNPFAFTPGQLNKLFNPKSLSAFYALGGLAGLEKGLRTDRKAGLSTDETDLEGSVSFEQATGASRKAVTEGAEADKESAPGVVSRPPTRTSRDEHYVDRKRVFSDNRLPEKKGKSLLQLMWITYQDKVLILLSVAAVVSLAVGLYQTFGINDGEAKVKWVEGVAIIGAIAIVVIVGSLNDYQKERQFAKLNRKKQDRIVNLVRSGKEAEISVFDIMVGDVLKIQPGDMVPVDGVLIEGFNVRCDESQTTGESDIIRKRAADDVYNAIVNREETKKLDPFIQSGSRVMEGIGSVLVTSTGINSSYGKTLMSLDEDPEMTPLQSKLNVIAEYIAKLGGAAGLLLFIVLFIKFLAQLGKQPPDVTPADKAQQFLDIFIVVVTIIVVAVPEGLPLAVTLALAFATKRMLTDNNLVRHLKACEVMGNATTICSDKTGTLTQNKMQVVAATIGTSHRFGGVRPPTAATEDGDADTDFFLGADISPTEFTGMLSSQVKDLVMKSIALNSTAFEGETNGQLEYIGSKTESALLHFSRTFLAMGPVAEERANAKTVQIIPFDSSRKAMGIVVRMENGKTRLYVKGASEIVLAKCTQILADPARDGSVRHLTDEDIRVLHNLIDNYGSRSLRTLGLVYRDFDRWPPRSARRTDGDKNEVAFKDVFAGMTFVGMVGIQDPLREGVLEAVRQCQRAGITVRMVTGDNRLTAKAIAKEAGILQANSLVMDGPEFRNLSKYEQEQIIPRLHVLARSSPEDKRILVKRLKDKGEIVAVTGDGTNDAPALKLADIGFSMGISGTEVAKEASAIILMDDNFTSIVKALKWGRAVNDAVKRFLQFQLTVNITAVLLTFVSAVTSVKEKSVLTAVQLLWVNLIMDTLAALALATDPPQDSVLNRKPEPRGSSIISTTMWKMIIGQSIYQLVFTFLLLYGSPSILPLPLEVELHMPADQIQTLVFNTFVWMQIFNQWNNRRLDNEFNIFEGITKNWYFLGINIAIAGLQVLIIFVGGPAFSIADGGQSGTLWAIAIVLGFISIPFGLIIRLIPDRLIEKLIPDYLRRRTHRVPGVTVSDEEQFDANGASGFYPQELADVRDELAFLKRIKGGRLNNLKFAMRHPREAIMQRSRSPSHSRTSSIKMPSTPTREDSFGSAFVAAAAAAGAGGGPGSVVGTPESNRKRSRSMRSRSNSALGAPTVMAGIVAAGVAAGWAPVMRQQSSAVSAGEEGENNSSSNNGTTLPSATSERQAEKMPEKEVASASSSPQMERSAGEKSAE